MLKSYSFMDSEVPLAFYYAIIEELKTLEGYLYSFNGVRADEARQRVFMHTITHYNPNKGQNLNAYLKSLIRDILKEGHRVVSVDFLEQTAYVDDDNNTNSANGEPIDTGKIPDFVDNLVEDMCIKNDLTTDIVSLALKYPANFIMLCKSLMTFNSSHDKFDPAFKRECLRIYRSGKNFNDACMLIYQTHGKDICWFLDLHKCSNQYWKEGNFAKLRNAGIKKCNIISLKKDISVGDSKDVPFEFRGSLTPLQRIYRVDYYGVWDMLCSLAEGTETNELKLSIGSHFLFQTPGGSILGGDPDYNSIYELLRVEIITNLLTNTRSKLITYGKEYMYMLNSTGSPLEDATYTACNLSLPFHFEDVTEHILSHTDIKQGA